MTNVRSTTKDFYELIRGAWTPANLSSKGLKSAMKRSKKQQSKSYLKRKAQLYEKWSKKTPSLDELIEDLEWSVGIKS